MKKGKRYAELTKLVDRTNNYDPQEAVALVKKLANAKFDETIEAHIRLGVDVRQTSRSVEQLYFHTELVKKLKFLYSLKMQKLKKRKQQEQNS